MGKPRAADIDAARVLRERDLLLRLLELGHQDEVSPFLEGALALIVEVTGARKGYVELYGTDERGQPRFYVAYGFEKHELAAVRSAVSTGVIKEAISTGRTISTASAEDDPRFKGRDSVKLQRIRAVLCSPIGDPSIGVIYLEGRKDVDPFSDSDVHYAELFARHIAPLADRLLARDEAAQAIDHTAAERQRLSVEEIAGKSKALAEVFRLMAVAAPTPLSVLFTGESGTGKSLFARALHRSSPRATGPFIEVNCAAIPETLFESELFGAEKGAHSTAQKRLAGKIDAAIGGTLLLDEVGEISPPVQSKLLMFLQSRRYYRLGSTTQLEADVRIVAATNANLEELVREKKFREDLYYRLNVLEIPIRPLRERREDIPLIAERMVRKFREKDERPLSLSHAALVALLEREWPGNVRELENALNRGWAVAQAADSSIIRPSDLFPERAASADIDGEATYDEATRAFQRSYLERSLARYEWNVSETARRIGMARSYLNELIGAHGLARTSRSSNR